MFNNSVIQLKSYITIYYTDYSTIQLLLQKVLLLPRQQASSSEDYYQDLLFAAC